MGQYQFRQDVKVEFKEALISGKLAGMVNEAVKGENISSADILFNVLCPLMAQHEGIEKFYCIFLDAKNRVIEMEPIFSGSLTSCSVYPREIIKTCLEKNAAALIVAHNHPSGDINPSPEDITITRRIFMACHVMGIVLHEHLICGNGKYLSLANEKIVGKFKRATETFFNDKI